MENLLWDFTDYSGNTMAMFESFGDFYSNGNVIKDGRIYFWMIGQRDETIYKKCCSKEWNFKPWNNHWVSWTLNVTSNNILKSSIRNTKGIT